MPSKKRTSSLVEKLVPVLMVGCIALAFAVGILWQKIQGLETAKSTSGSANTTQAGTENQAAPVDANALPNNVQKLTEVQAKKIPAVSGTDYIRGNKNADIMLVEYSDLECPFCKQFHATAKKAVEDYSGKVAWVWRHYPIVQLHSKAPKEAEATECANELGGVDAFWKMADKIYEVSPTNNGLDLATLPKLASDIGLNQAAFKTCLDSGKYKAKIDEAVKAAVATGASGTPANFIINKKGEIWIIPGALPIDSVKTIIDEALQS
jgi:protein-disulfide isomerase